MNLRSVIRNARLNVAGELGWQWGKRQLREDAESERLFRSFAATRGGQRRLSPEEAHWFDQVDALRQELNRSTKPVAYYDHGWDARDKPLDASQYISERIVQTTVGDLPTMHGKWALMLFRLLRDLQPVRCLEMGACTGISALFQASALRLNGRGHLVTLEGNRPFVELATENFARLGLQEQVDIVFGEFDDTLRPALERLKPLDYAFIDGDHHEETTVAYYTDMRPYLAERAVLVFDDIRWSSGMWRAWERIVRSPTSLRTYDVGAYGVVVYSSTAPDHCAPISARHRHYRIRL